MPAVPADPILILTGPPGVGKTTVADLLADRAEHGVHLETDLFFHFVRAGYVEPWRPESHEQNRAVMRVAAAAAAAYADAGYLTVVDGIVIPGAFFEPLRDGLRAAGHRVAYAVLRAPLATCVARAGARERDALERPEVVEQLWRSFADLGELERHAFDLGDERPEEVAELLGARLEAGELDVA